MSDTPKRPAAIEALMQYQQADEEGVMVLVSRQAIHETADIADEMADALEVIVFALKGDRGAGSARFWAEIAETANAALAKYRT